MNLLDNAMTEPAAGFPEDGEKWISLDDWAGLEPALLSCAPTAACPVSAGSSTSKEDSRAHGYGMELMSQVVREYRGTFETTWYTDSFSARIFLPDAVKDGEL
ncbi:MAG: GHKL domain-containing protein [Enterocloster sp.]